MNSVTIGSEKQGGEQKQVPDAGVSPLSALRSSAGIFETVSHVPNLLSLVEPAWRDSRCPEGKLVRGPL